MAGKIKNVTIASFLITILLLAYVSFILISNYRSQTALQQTILKQFDVENERLAITLSNFFYNRKEDIVNLNASQPLDVFFENKALGMSMEYGLKQSIPPIKKRFYELFERSKAEKIYMYRRILFLDAGGNILIDVFPPDLIPPTLSDARKYLSPEHNKPFFTVTDGGKEIVVSAGYFFKGRYSGQTVAWLQPEYLSFSSMIDSISSHRLSWLVAKEAKIPLSRGSLITLPDVGIFQTGTVHKVQIADGKGRTQNVVASKTSVRDTPFALVTIVPVEDLFEGLEPKRLLIGMGVFALVIMGVAIIAYRINIKSLVLTARLDEARLHEAEILAKNKQLEEEMVERHHAEKALRQSEERYRLLTETSPNAVTVSDLSGKITMLNQRALDTYGHGEAAQVLGRNIMEWVPEEGRERAAASFARVLAGGPVTDFELRLTKADGTLFWGSINASSVRDSEGNPQFIIIVTTDVTERKKTEVELLRTQKLESLGLLAGGIAHDFNNLLQGVFGYISLAKLSLDPQEKAFAMLEQAEKALTLSVNLTVQLLTFSKGGKPVKKNIVLRPVVENAVKFALSGSRSDYRITAAGDLWRVEADEGQIGQVIQNIVLNAHDAMPDGGIVEISAGNIDVQRKSNPSLPDGGKFVKLTIKDSGMGIPEQHLSKIFDPFFTTKQKGSGLGLATSHAIVRNHGGVIEATSELGKGSTFAIWLPAIQTEAEEGENQAPSSAPGRKGRILVMDDEEMLRTVAAKMIQALGHEVECARDGEEAVEMFRQARQSGLPFDIVILDLTVKGGMSGDHAVRLLHEIDPNVKAVVSSGYSNNPVVADYRAYGFAAFLNKPYVIEALKECLSGLLV